MVRGLSTPCEGADTFSAENEKRLSMEVQTGMVNRFSVFLHQYFLWLLFSAYALASVAPAYGLWLRTLSLGKFEFLGQRATFTLPPLMLAFLLFNAGLGAQSDRLRTLIRKPFVLVVGLAVNLAA